MSVLVASAKASTSLPTTTGSLAPAKDLEATALAYVASQSTLARKRSVTTSATPTPMAFPPELWARSRTARRSTVVTAGDGLTGEAPRDVGVHARARDHLADLPQHQDVDLLERQARKVGPRFQRSSRSRFEEAFAGDHLHPAQAVPRVLEESQTKGTRSRLSTMAAASGSISAEGLETDAVKARGSLLLPEAYRQHLGQAALDRRPEVRMRLDPVNRHDGVAAERRFGQVDRLTACSTCRLARRPSKHRRGSPEPPRRRRARAGPPPGPPARPPVGPHGRHQDRLRPPGPAAPGPPRPPRRRAGRYRGCPLPPPPGCRA